MRKTISLRMLQVTFFSALFAAMMVLTSFTSSTSNEVEDWTLITSDLNIDVYGQIASCESGEVYLFKLKNNANRNQSVEIVITVSNEPAYGPMTFVKTVSANSETSAECSENELQLPKMVKGKDLSKVSVKLTLK